MAATATEDIHFLIVALRFILTSSTTLVVIHVVSFQNKSSKYSPFRSHSPLNESELKIRTSSETFTIGLDSEGLVELNHLVLVWTWLHGSFLKLWDGPINVWMCAFEMDAALICSGEWTPIDRKSLLRQRKQTEGLIDDVSRLDWKNETDVESWHF